MALINCPECGNQMSDKAAACPHCGASAVPAVQTATCAECGGILRPEDKVCPTCGCPAESAQPEPEQPIQQPIPAQPVITQYAQQPVLNNTAGGTAVMQKSRKKLWIPIVIVLAVLCIAAGVVFVLLNNSVKQVTDEPYVLTVGNTYYEGTYSGGWRYDKPNGTGIFKRNERRDLCTTYEGEWEDGSLKRGKISYYDGGVYEGEFRDLLLNGEGIIIRDGNVYEGEFENNRLNGQGRITYADGGVLTGEFADDEIVNGTGKKPFGNLDNNFFYEGEWHDSKFTGYARRSFYSQEGTTYYEGEYKDGEFNGHGKYTHADGTVQEGQWENGKFIG